MPAPSDPRRVVVLREPALDLPPRLAYSPEEVAQLIGGGNLSLDTVYDWLNDPHPRSLRGKKVGKRWVISVAALAEFLDMEIPFAPEPRSATG